MFTDTTLKNLKENSKLLEILDLVLIKERYFIYKA